MAAIDSSILIGLLAIVSVLAYIFVLRKIKTKPNPVDAAIITAAKEEVPGDQTETLEVQRSEELSKKRHATECFRQFGYLSSRPKKSTIPRECLQCGKMAECMLKKKPRKIRSKRIDTLPTVDEETAPRAREEAVSKIGPQG